MRHCPRFIGISLFLAFSLLVPFTLAQQSALGQQAAQASATQALITQPVDENQRTVLKGNTHPLALPKYDRGAAPPSLAMERMLLVLKRSDAQEAALRQLLEEQQDKSSPNFHKWLSPDDYGKQFGPSDQDIQTVTSWLQSQGFQVAQASKGRTVVEFSGTANQVTSAFHTEIHKYSVNGAEHWANTSDPEIPTALTPVVAGVNTLHNFPRTPLFRSAGAMSRSSKTGAITPAQPLFTIPAPNGCGVQTSDCFAVGPYDFATIYNVLPLWTASPAIDGTGQTVAIVGETDINPQDVTDFRNFFGLPPANLQIIHNGPPPGIIPGEVTEALLDVQWSSAVAKAATIDFVVTASTESSAGIDLSAQYIVDNNLAPVMSESYGFCELGLGNTGNQFFSQLWQQAAAQGITVFLASGDGGAAGCDDFNAAPPAPAQFGLAVSGFSSTPYNVTVGGTDFFDLSSNASTYWNLTNDSTTRASAKSYIPETTWNDTCTNGVFAQLGLTTNPETNCNDSRIADFVTTVGAGGGQSGCTVSDGQHPSSCSGGWPKPTWQTALTPNDGKRDVPDVSLFSAIASPSGSFYVVCEADLIPSGSSCNPSDSSTSFIAIGGTSASSPAMAGIMALVNQKPGNGARQGNANYVFYKLAAQQGSGVFNDVTNGTITMPCAKGSPNCTTTVSSHQYGVLSGYATTSGFDLATGLGSVNAANLVNKWSTVSFTQSATTLNSVTPTTLTHGQSAAINVTVAPKSGTGATPTGAVALMGGPNNANLGIDNHALTGGTASWSTTALPGGTYNLTAHYPGDATYGPSDSNPISITVNKENSQTQVFLVTFDLATGAVLNPGTTTAAYGSPYLLRMNVANGSGKLCGAFQQIQVACASGTMTLTDNGSPLDGGHFALNNAGYAEDLLVQLTGGTHAVAASYGGDNSFNPSSASAQMTITPASTTITAPTTSTISVGDPFTAAATVQTQSNGAAPTGTVSFSINGNPMSGTVTYMPTAGSVTNPASLAAQISSTVAAPGSYLLTAKYNGDVNYAATAVSAGTNATAKYRAPNLSVTPLSQTLAAGSNATLTALLTTSNGASAIAPTGMIPFFNGTSGAAVTGTETYTPISDSSGPQLQATFTFTPTSSGLYTAQYAGDTNYPAAQTLNQAMITVTGSDFDLSMSASTVDIPGPGASGSVSVFVGAQSTYSGTINFIPASCSGLPAESACSFSPPSVTGAGSTLLTITTTAPHALAILRVPSSRFGIQLAATGGFAIAGMFLLGLSTNRRWKVVLSIVAVALLAASFGCGGGGSSSGGKTDPGTPRGTYTVTVSGTSGATHSASFTLVVH